MARQKRDTATKSIRFIAEIADAIDKYADDQLISVNSAVNQLLRDRLQEMGYLPKGSEPPT